MPAACTRTVGSPASNKALPKTAKNCEISHPSLRGTRRASLRCRPHAPAPRGRPPPSPPGSQPAGCAPRRPSGDASRTCECMKTVSVIVDWFLGGRAEETSRYRHMHQLAQQSRSARGATRASTCVQAESLPYSCFYTLERLKRRVIGARVFKRLWLYLTKQYKRLAVIMFQGC